MTKVLVAEVPPALPALVRRAVAGEHDIELLVVPGGEIELLVAMGSFAADVVVVGTRGEAVPPIVERLVDEYGRVGIVALDVQDVTGLVWRLVPSVELLGALEPSRLLTAIQRAATWQNP